MSIGLQITREVRLEGGRKRREYDVPLLPLHRTDEGFVCTHLLHMDQVILGFWQTQHERKQTK